MALTPRWTGFATAAAMAIFACAPLAGPAMADPTMTTTTATPPEDGSAQGPRIETTPTGPNVKVTPSGGETVKPDATAEMGAFNAPLLPGEKDMPGPPGGTEDIADTGAMIFIMLFGFLFFFLFFIILIGWNRAKAEKAAKEGSTSEPMA